MRERLHALVNEMINHHFNLDEVVNLVEKVFIEKMLENNDHNISKTAKQMNLHRNTLTRKIKMLDVENGKQAGQS